MVTAAWTVKGDLADGNLLAESVHVHMRAVVRRMEKMEEAQREVQREPRSLGDKMPPEFRTLQQTYIELERLYRAITGRNPTFPKVESDFPEDDEKWGVRTR